MLVNGKPYRTIWVHPENSDVIQIIDQRHLPHEFVIENITNAEEMAVAIQEMHLRGAGLIGAAAAYGMYLASVADLKEPVANAMRKAADLLLAMRPTAVNLSWAIDRQMRAINACSTLEECVAAAFQTARAIADEDAAQCRRIGAHGLPLLEEIATKKDGPVNILTHCNAGWLAFVDYGTATAPIYMAHDMGIDVHVWVDETRPRNQGARLTAWELGQSGVSHTIVADNTGGHLMQHGLVDIVITGTDRVARNGDVANKIGTYLKALAASDNNIPFYVAAPSSSIDWNCSRGSDVPIESRDAREVKYISGKFNNKTVEVLLAPAGSNAANYAFDVTPKRLVNGLITDRGICAADENAMLSLYPEHKIQ